MISKQLFSQQPTDIFQCYKNRISDSVISETKSTYDQIKIKQRRFDDLHSPINKISSEITSSGSSANNKYQTTNPLPLSSEIDLLKKELKDLNQKLKQQLLLLPNIPDSNVPIGNTSAQNAVFKVNQKKPSCNFKPKTYWQLDQKLKLIEANIGTKLSGNRFSVLNPNGA